MRYLAQLVRETTARVRPARHLSWLKPAPALVRELTQENTVEWPAFPAASSAGAPARFPVKSPQNDGTGAVKTADFTARDARPLSAPESPRIYETSSVNAPVIETIHRTESVSSSPLSFSEPVSANDQRPIDARGARGDRIEASDVFPALTESAPRKMAENEGREPHVAQPTMAWVLSEIARRQERIDIEYQAEQKAPRVIEQRSSAHEMDDRARAKRAQDEVHVNIGSIVVEMEREPRTTAPPPAKPPVNRPNENRNSRAWARRFLDR